jgi:hypothetical protein
VSDTLVEALERHAPVMIGKILCVAILGLPRQVRCREGKHRVHDKIMGKCHCDEPAQISYEAAMREGLSYVGIRAAQAVHVL